METKFHMCLHRMEVILLWNLISIKCFDCFMSSDSLEKQSISQVHRLRNKCRSCALYLGKWWNSITQIFSRFYKGEIEQTTPVENTTWQGAKEGLYLLLSRGRESWELDSHLRIQELVNQTDSLSLLLLFKKKWRLNKTHRSLWVWNLEIKYCLVLCLYNKFIKTLSANFNHMYSAEYF